MTETGSCSDRHKFFADVMLGTLARWLRVLGYDTCYDNQISDDELIARCSADHRVALTRDQRLVQRRVLKNSLFIKSDSLGEQLREVLGFTGDPIDEDLLLTRCLECNTRLQPVAKSQVVDLVPPYVYRTQTRFERCPQCTRVFWAGTHRRRMLERINRLLDSNTGQLAT